MRLDVSTYKPAEGPYRFKCHAPKISGQSTDHAFAVCRTRMSDEDCICGNWVKNYQPDAFNGLP